MKVVSRTAILLNKAFDIAEKLLCDSEEFKFTVSVNNGEGCVSVPAEVSLVGVDRTKYRIELTDTKTKFYFTVD